MSTALTESPPPSTNATPRPHDRPLDESSRIGSLDILRGVAVLGIFVMNSRNFALPLRHFDNPAFPRPAGSAAGTADLWAWGLANTLFEDKMIAIFSILFGAGIVIAAARTARPALVHYRRMFWLMVIGLIHAFALWYGDILNTYAVCGALLYPFRRLQPALLIGVGVLVLTLSAWPRLAPRIEASLGRRPAATAPALPGANPEPLKDRLWREANATEEPAYRGSYLDLARWRAKLNIVWHWYGGIEFTIWRSAGYMLMGMGLVQFGVLSASRSSAVYRAMIIGGYGAGLTMVAAGFWPQLARALGRAPELSPEARQILGTIAWTLRYLGTAGVAIGHIGLVMLLCRAPLLGRILAPLAAVGRTALSNYLLQTVVAVIIFDGWALGHWARWNMSEIALLVLAVWAVQLVLSALWLRLFRYGPAEWAWRSLTYGRAERFRRAAPA
jgi:uncharacterized protein